MKITAFQPGRPAALAAVALTTVLVPTRPLPARESWPGATADAKRQAEEFKKREQEVLNRIQPQFEAWARKGKPYLPWAQKPVALRFGSRGVALTERRQ
jgi:hypothetical protein